MIQRHEISRVPSSRTASGKVIFTMKTMFFAIAMGALCTAGIAQAAGPAPGTPSGDLGQERQRPDDAMRGPGHGMKGPGAGMRMDPARMFDRIDANHDGSVSRAEFMTAHQQMMQHRGNGRGGPRPDARGDDDRRSGRTPLR